jgi:O-succinylhomoserine sulfhydrylase
VDNCFCSPALQRPLALGADLVMHSGTKYLDGQGRVMAGALCGPKKLVVDSVRAGDAHRRHDAVAVQRLGGAQGLETLSLRMKAQSDRALAVAQWLERTPRWRVSTPGLPSHPQHALAMAQQSGLGGAVVSFDVRADSPRGRPRCGLPRHRQHAGAEHRHQPGRHQVHHHPPGQHVARPPDRGAAPGRRHRPGLIRLAVGLEHVDDIKADLLRGLASVETLP